MSTLTVEIKGQLTAALDLIPDEDHWTQGIHRSGDRRCASGALVHTGAPIHSPAYNALQRAMFELDNMDRYPSNPVMVCAWNDTHTYQQVREAFELAIARAA